MDRDPRLQDEADCTRLCVDFALHLDARRYDAVLELFTDDATFDRIGTLYEGRDAIARFLEARPPNVVTRHLCTNVRIVFQSADEATGVCYVLFVSGKCGDEGRLPIAPSPAGVVEYHDVFRRGANGWRIRERRIRPVFVP